MAEHNGISLRVQTPMQPIGTPGLKQWGVVREEFLQELSGPQGVQTYKKMRDNSPIIGAILFAVEMLVRPVGWSCTPADDSQEAADLAAFARHALFDDCLNTWYVRLSDILSMLPFGWALLEWTLKRRQGPHRDPWRSSSATDGRLGFADMGLRAQDTLMQWVFNERDEAQAMMQQPPQGGAIVTIPRAKTLLFRPTSYKSNPEGRALDPNTPIPTPDGWRLLDELEPGSKVFDEQGRIRYVTARQDWEDRPCYAVRFQNGTEIIADANHQWLTQTQGERNTRQPGQVRTTAQIVETLRTADGIKNHSIPWAGSLDYPTQLLPVDPYYLGLWLGDGYARSGQLACHAQDADEIARLLEKRGYATQIIENGPSGGLGRALRVYGSERWAADNPASLLRRLGLLQHKMIPPAYLHGSRAQRLDLLAGLMDSDGTVDKDGRCEFTNTNMVLVDGVAELVRSLGGNAFVSLRKRANGISHKHDSWCVKFTPTWCPFLLARKAARIKVSRARMGHYIVEALSVAPRRTVCLEVDSPSHLFLAGAGMIPTHNSILRTAYRPWYNLTQIENIEGIGIERDLAGLPVVKVPPEVMAGRSAGAGAEARLIYQQYEQLAVNIRQNEQSGIVFPLVYDQDGHELYKVELLSTGGRRQFDTDTIIKRYELRIAQSVLADMILVGHEQVGSYALASSKTNLFATALGGYLDAISDVFQQEAIPVLWHANGLPLALMPHVEHGDVEHVDIKELSEAIKNMAQAGFDVTDLDRPVRLKMGLPVAEETEELG